MIEHAYIHIPFCVRKCKYCSFVSGFDIKYKEIYLDTLLKEIKLRYYGEKLKTLYIGGGTPSLLSVSDIENLLKCFNIGNSAEITLEVNPETVELIKFKDLKKAGINRISIGVQTFDDTILNYIDRSHSENQIYRAIDTIRLAQFDNISIDLIYGLPFQTKKLFEQDLIKTENIGVEHISTYGLKIEKGAYFYKNPPLNLPDDDIQAEMYNLLCDYLYKYNHYEISNFALKGYESEHNCAYWKNKEYYGFGVNASGYENNLRYKNQTDFKNYINNPLKKEEKIYLSEKEIMENEIILALRLQEGIEIKKINKKFNIDFSEKYRKIIKKYSDLELLTLQDNIVRLNRKGVLLSNEIMSEFIDY